MAISLSKGQTISLKKESAGLKRVHMGLGWDPVAPKGFFAKLTGPKDIDLDASVITFDASKQPTGIVFFGQLQSADGSILHTGDNLTGEGDGDDEVIKIDLDRLDSNVETLVFFVNSYRGQTFNEVDNAFCRIMDDDTQKELCRFTLTDQGAHTGVVMAVLSRSGGDWQLKAVGAPGVGRKADELVPDALQHI
ncbi:TerD family protein [Yoonia sp. R2-816]|uniref:TerD family protein n=1 Tax=Yoonia sp. R2-816 TaxID=3342638 RepID=UPI0037270F58